MLSERKERCSGKAGLVWVGLFPRREIQGLGLYEAASLGSYISIKSQKEWICNVKKSRD